jgi:glucose-1-phosphate cytidylyltransferase
VKAVLLAGGLGTRMREETEFRPKPMVEIGGKPIVWHIMRNLASFGISDFIIASGYKHEVIENYFIEHPDWYRIEDQGKHATFQGKHDEQGWRVTVAFTGEMTQTGGRVFQVGELLGDQRFFVTYGDGLADVDVRKLIAFHEHSGSLGTLTAVQPTSRFGVTDINSEGKVIGFHEKPRMKDWISIGFFIFEPSVMTYLDDDCGLEEAGLAHLARDGQLSAFKHEGFWQPMDTYREYTALQKLWNGGHPPWKVW